MNAVKTQPIGPAAESGAPEISGKLVIIAVLFVAIAGAAFSWFFRYNATHRAAEFWGQKITRAIRDSAVVQVYTPKSAITLPKNQSAGMGGIIDDPELHDISSARGLVHFRNALLEDRSFEWPAEPMSPDIQWTRGLAFGKLADPDMTMLLFSRDFKFVTDLGRDQMLSCQPIANGLQEMFDEFAATPEADAAKNSR
jgi:hypothetical protein